MTRTWGEKVRFLGQMILIFILATQFFHFIRFFDLRASEEFALELPWQRFILLLVIGILGGLIFGIVELNLDRPKFRRWSYGRLLIFKAFMYFFLVKFIMWIGLIILTRRSPLDLDIEWAREMINSRVFWVSLAYFSVVMSLISFFRAIDQKFGPGVLWNMLLGKYHKPQEEERIFMFLDLKSSTTIAEKLGHLKFSRFIQDCFFDLNEIIKPFQAEIYQYVGDEAVLTWLTPRGLANNNCLELYFAYRDRLERKRDYYLEEYGEVPVFKAGLHYGKVMVAEVGVVKKEIAFHGDVLNTTARIQGQCNHYKEQLLISQNLLSHLQLPAKWNSASLGAIQLKGKMEEVAVWAVQENHG